jgi:peptide methionine sulfoxide reductase MsrA
MNIKTNKTRISRSSCTRTNSELEFELSKILVDLVVLDLFKNFKSNHDPRTENRSLNLQIYRSIFFYFMNNEQATSDRVQAKNSQAKRGALINFFYS